MAKSTVINCQHVGVGLKCQVSISVGPPSLGDVTGVTMNLFAAALSARIVLMPADCVGSSQLITTRAGERAEDSKSNGKVCVKSLTGPDGTSAVDKAFSLRR